MIVHVIDTTTAPADGADGASSEDVSTPTGPPVPDADRAFGARLRTARRRAGCSQGELSDRLSEVGVRLSASSIARIEAGAQPVRLTEAIGLAHALSVNLCEMIPEIGPVLGRGGLARATQELELLRRTLDGQLALLARESGETGPTGTPSIGEP
jgi:transcriptional regulator with XRE-family HTH domain